MDSISSNLPQDNPSPAPKHPGGRPRKVNGACTKCGESDPTKFYWNRGYKESRCKRCKYESQGTSSYYANKEQYLERNRQNTKDWYAAHPHYRRQRVYGLTEQEYSQMLVAQNNACRICKQAFTEENMPHVDHDHATNRVRGLLCGKCNRGIGFFQDSPMLLRGAANYLEQ